MTDQEMADTVDQDLTTNQSPQLNQPTPNLEYAELIQAPDSEITPFEPDANLPDNFVNTSNTPPIEHISAPWGSTANNIYSSPETVSLSPQNSSTPETKTTSFTPPQNPVMPSFEPTVLENKTNPLVYLGGFLALSLVGIAIGLGFSLLTSTNTKVAKNIAISPAPSKTISNQITPTPTKQISKSITPTTTPAKPSLLEKDFQSDQITNLYASYHLYYPKSWKLTTLAGDKHDSLDIRLSKGASEIRIFQGISAPSTCVYNQNTQVDKGLNFVRPVSISRSDIVWQRGELATKGEGRFYQICEKGQADFTTATQIGMITLQGPNISPQDLADFDAMFSKVTLDPIKN